MQTSAQGADVVSSAPEDLVARLRRIVGLIEAFNATRQPELIEEAAACFEPFHRVIETLPEAAFILGRLEFRRQHWAAARDAYERVIQAQVDHPHTRLRTLEELTSSLIELQEFERALEVAQDHVSLRPFDSDILFRLGGILCVLNREDDAIAVIDQAQRRHPNLIMRRPEQFAAMQAEAVGRGIPTILVNTQFKSGSMFIAEMLCKGLSAPRCYITFPPFTRKIVPRWLETFALGGAVCQEHLVPDEESLRHLSEVGINRLIVHIRDPRQAMISALHHLEKRRHEPGIEHAFVRLRLFPGDIENWSMERRIDHYLDRGNFAAEAQWVGGWRRVRECGAFDGAIMLTKYEDFKRDTRRYFAGALDFFAIPRERFDWSVLDAEPAKGRLHFRKGSSTEWMEILTPQQKAKAERLMADAGADCYL